MNFLSKLLWSSLTKLIKDIHEFPLEAPLVFVDVVTEAAARASQLVKDRLYF